MISDLASQWIEQEPEMLINLPKQGYDGPSSVVTDYSDSF